LVIQW